MNIDLFNQQLITQERMLLQELDKWEEVHERVLKKKSRATWIKHGDRNSKYFFAHLKSRQARNIIASIYTEQGVKLSDPALVQQEFLQFFQNLLGTIAPTLPCIDLRVDRDGPCLTMLQ